MLSRCASHNRKRFPSAVCPKTLLTTCLRRWKTSKQTVQISATCLLHVIVAQRLPSRKFNRDLFSRWITGTCLSGSTVRMDLLRPQIEKCRNPTSEVYLGTASYPTRYISAKSTTPVKDQIRIQTMPPGNRSNRNTGHRCFRNDLSLKLNRIVPTPPRSPIRHNNKCPSKFRRTSKARKKHSGRYHSDFEGGPHRMLTVIRRMRLT